MKNSSIRLETDWLLRISAKTFSLRTALVRIREMIGPVSQKTCLLVNGDSAGLALQLCQEGVWSSVHRDAEVAAVLAEHTRSSSLLLEGGKLPHADGVFDVVVVYHVLEFTGDARSLIAECHRVLKTKGRLVVHVPHAKTWSALRGLRRLFGFSRDAGSPPPTYYRLGDLFEVVKDGFDVNQAISYSRFFSECVEELAGLVIGYAVGGLQRSSAETADARRPIQEKILRVRSALYPLAVTASVMDYLLFFTKGYCLLGRATRRSVWKPRRIPVLADGRSIADAAINTKIGTAGPF